MTEYTAEQRKGIYAEIGSALQIEQEFCHANKAYCEGFIEDIERVIPDDPNDENSIISREDGIKVFNRLCEFEQIKPLQSPIGYMTLDGNVYDKVKEAYDSKYQNAIKLSDAGQLRGSIYAIESVAGKIDKVTRNDMSEALPKGINWSELRFVRATPEMEQNINKMAHHRLQMTLTNSIRRQDNNRNLFAERTNSFNKYRDGLIDNIKESMGYVEKEEVKVQPKNNDFGLSL